MNEIPRTANVVVAVASSRAEADLILGLLQSNGIDAFVSPDDAGGQEPELQVQGVRVLVPASDGETARELLTAVTG